MASPRIVPGLVSVVWVLLLGFAGELRAQVINFDDLSAEADYFPIPTNYGSTADIAVTNTTRSGFGNTAVVSPCSAGGVTSSNVRLWGAAYSSLTNVAFACQNGRVGEFFFQPDPGTTVFLNSLQIGSYPANPAGIGPARVFSVFVYDTSFNELYSAAGLVDATLTLNPGVSSTSGLYLQWGTDWNTGIDNINLSTGPNVVPEPGTVLLVGTGLAGLAGAAYRRRRHKEA